MCVSFELYDTVFVLRLWFDVDGLWRTAERLLSKK